MYDSFAYYARLLTYWMMALPMGSSVCVCSAHGVHLYSVPGNLPSFFAGDSPAFRNRWISNYAGRLNLVFTYREMMQIVLKYTHRKRPIISLPWFLGRMQGWTLEKLPENILTLTRDQVRGCFPFKSRLGPTLLCNNPLALIVSIQLFLFIRSAFGHGLLDLYLEQVEQLKMDNIAFPDSLVGPQYAGIAPPNGEQTKSGSKSGPSSESFDHGFAALLETYGGTGHVFEAKTQLGKEIISTGTTSLHQILPSYLSS